MSRSLKVVFMGTSEFAVPALRLLGSTLGIEVVAVVTTPDKQAGRSLKLTQSPVNIAAYKLNLPLLQPIDLRDPFFLKAIDGFHPDIAAVVAFRILPTELFSLPRLGCVNLHASLLPELRGAAPIQWALIRGYEQTGVSTFLIERKVDTGSIILQEAIQIDPDDDAGSLSEKLSIIGSRLLLESIRKLGEGVLKPVNQVGNATAAPKITRELSHLDWTKSSTELHNLIRGLSPEPAAFTMLNGKMLKVFKTKPISEIRGEPGVILDVGDGMIKVGTADVGLGLREVQLEGKRRMATMEFLRGNKVSVGTRLE